MITIVAQFTALPGKTEAILKEIEPMITATRRESGCISYVLHQDIKNPDNFAFIEQWKDQASVDAHMQSDHFKTIGPKLNALRVAPSTVHLYKEVI
ncbi:MAG: antibiotic biosynthesis monooxygenase [Spirochaetes bacterium]|nr:antibiotic biosynthesis monooxygenase [Spirochaetota bacterium]